MSLGELLDAWENPMSDPARKKLLQELRARNYRVKSLPDVGESQHGGPARTTPDTEP